MSSANSAIPEHRAETESQFILRLPPEKANSLRNAMRDGEPLADRLAIKFDSDIRNASVKFDGTIMPARLYDLPTITESYKTLDRKNFYKTADISQILICKEPQSDDKHINPDELFASVGGAGKREYLFPHGITPPLKNVRKRRFRKTLKKKYVDYSEIEKEVKRLFKFDCEAIDSRYEIVEESKLDKTQPSNFAVHNDPSPIEGGPLAMSAENSQNIDVHDLFGEECSSSDESDDDDDDDDDKEDDKDDDDKDEDMDIDGDNDDERSDADDFEEVTQNELSNAPPAADIAAEAAAASDLIAQTDDSEERRQELNRELAKIQERIQTQENEMRGLDNQALRQRLQSVLDSLHEQENEFKKQLEDLPDKRIY